MIVEKQPTGNTLEVTRRRDGLRRAEAGPRTGVDLDPTIFRPAGFIERSLANLPHAMMVGCILVVIILVIFLYRLANGPDQPHGHPALINRREPSCYYGGHFNTMVLAGLVIAMGEVVDDAIIDVENIVRRLRLNASGPHQPRSFDVVLQASLEVRSARSLRQPDRDPGVRSNFVSGRSGGLILGRLQSHIFWRS